MSWIIQREYWFSAAHRLEGHEKCGRLHGHNYKVMVYMSRDELSGGMVLDFALLDRACKPIIDELDHKYLVSESNRASDDPYAGIARANDHAVDMTLMYSTAEEIATYLQKEIQSWVDEVEKIPDCQIQVWVWETHKSAATYTA